MASALDLSDSECIQCILQGEKNVFETLIRRYNPYLYKIGRTYGFSIEDTQDLMQDAFYNAYCHLADFAERSTFRTWLSRIMLNLCFHKKHKSHQPLAELSDKVVNGHHSLRTLISLDAERNLISKELGQVIERALEQLPEPYRIVFTLRVLNGNSVAEAATLLGLTESNVKVRLNRAKRILRNNLHHTYSKEDIYEFNLIYCNAVARNVMQRIEPVPSVV